MQPILDSFSYQYVDNCRLLCMVRQISNQEATLFKVENSEDTRH